MKKIFLLSISIAIMLLTCKNETSSKTNEQPFLWAVATAAYQVEGAYQTDGKGESKCDF